MTKSYFTLIHNLISRITSNSPLIHNALHIMITKVPKRDSCTRIVTFPVKYFNVQTQGKHYGYKFKSITAIELESIQSLLQFDTSRITSKTQVYRLVLALIRAFLITKLFLNKCIYN